MRLTLKRQPSTADATLGELYDGDNILCFTLEDVVREVSGMPVEQWKIWGKTAIPLGHYQIDINYSPHFKNNLPELLSVPGFEGIRIHAGNTAKDTDGCILVGMKCVTPSMIGDSVIALTGVQARIQAALDAGEEVWITVQRA